MPDWLVERGIGETRYARVDNGEIVEARITLDETVPAGSVLNARLIQIGRTTIASADGQEYLLPGGASGKSQGSAIAIEVVREVIPGPEPWKRPLARLVIDREVAEAHGVAAQPGWFADAWDDLIDEARTGLVAFPGGELRISPTPAMTLVDVDGYLQPRELALAGAKAAARAILRLDIGGSIGIDLPTISGKTDRQTIGEAVDAILPRPFERTAMNGFGFVQIVRPRRRASLAELAQDRAAFEARVLLRRAGGETGPTRLAAHPAVAAILEANSGWLDRLARQVGGAVSLRGDPSLPISGGYAEPA